MAHKRAALSVALLMCTAPALGQSYEGPEVSDRDLCVLYGELGASVASFMLPQTLEDILSMAMGRNPDLAAGFASALTEDLTGDVRGSLNALAPEDAALLTEHAGQTAIQMLLSAQADTPSTLRDRMGDFCRSKGPRMIMGEMQSIKSDP